MTQTRKTSMFVLAVLLSAALLSALLIWGGENLEHVSAADSLIYSLNFADEGNRGKNTAGTSHADATIVSATGVDYVADAIQGKTAISFTSEGTRINYLTLPGSVMNNDSVTIAGWFYVSSSLPNWSRIAEVYVNNDNLMSIMPYAPNWYNGLHVYCKMNGQLVTGANNVENMFFGGGREGAAYNTPAFDGILPVYDGWTHYAYEFTKDGFKYYQNGQLTLSKEGDFTASKFFAESGNVVFGATFLDGTPDFTGKYADIRVYNKALSSDEIKSEYNFSYNDFLSASYDFESGTKDSVRGYNGTLCGNAQVKQAYDSTSNVLYLDGSAPDGNENRRTKTSMEIPIKLLSGHRQVSVSMDLYVDSECGSYSRAFAFETGKEQFFCLGAKWEGNPLNSFRFTTNNATSVVALDVNTAFNKWVNLTFTTDGNKAQVFVDGIPTATIDNFNYTDSIFWEGTSIFSIGKTAVWDDAPMKGAVDNIKIWQVALSETDVLKELGISDIADHKTAVDKVAEKFAISYDGDAATISLPSNAGEGVTVSYTFSGDAITSEGNVAHTNVPQEVIVTATFKRGDYQVSKNYTVTVNAKVIENPSIVNDSTLDAVKFNDSYYKGLMTTNLDYMMKLDKDRLLYNYRRIAGLDTKGAKSYGAWIAPEGGGSGQFETHYVIALAKASQTMPEYSYNGETVLQRLNYMVTAMRECQVAFAAKYPAEAGYLGAIIIDQYDALAEGRDHASDGSNIWVPWYFHHKTLEMALDVYNCAADESLRAVGLQILKDAADWTYNKMSSYTEDVRAKILVRREYGGMAEVLYQIYGVTKNVKHFKAAGYFEEKALLDNIHDNIDILKGLHANTTIPKFLGAAAAYEVTGNEYYKTIAVNAFEMIFARCYVNGSTGCAEFWLDEKGTLTPSKDSSETCCTYNMIKLADYLYRWSGEKKYLDYIENAYQNHILASMAPDTGLKTYLTNMDFGYYKIYHTPENSFWCCACTGMESFAKLPQYIYFSTDDSVTVNMFMPSTYKWGDVEISQTEDINTTQHATFTVKGNGTFTLKLRIPDWAKETSVKINGQPATLTANNGFYEINRTWDDGDTVEYNLPFKVEKVKLPGSERDYALTYGPLLLVVDLGNEGVLDVRESQTDFGSAYTGSISKTIILEAATLEESLNVRTENGQLYVDFTTANQGTLVFRPFNQLFHNRYGVYMTYYDSIEDYKKLYYVDGNEFSLDFDNNEDLNQLQQKLNSSDSPFEIKGNALVTGEGESKLLSGLNITTDFSVDVIVGGINKQAKFNAGVYLFAKDATAAKDMIRAYNVQVVREEASDYYTINLFKFNYGYAGKLASAKLKLADNGLVKLHIAVKNGRVKVFVDDVMNPILDLTVEEGFITADGFDVGLRSRVPSTFSRFVVTNAQLPVGTYPLTKTLAACETIGTSFTTDSYARFVAAKTAAQQVLAKTDKTQAEVNAATTALKEALDGLVELVDTTELESLVTLTKSLVSQLYTADSFAKLEQALADIEKADFATISRADYEALYNTLTKALLGLKVDEQAKKDFVADSQTHQTATAKEQLKNALILAKSIKRTDYTAESFDALNKAIETAEKVLGNEQATKAQYEEQVANLSTAANQLVAKSVEPQPQPEPQPENKGCGSVIGSVGLMSLIAFVGVAAIAVGRKKRD